MIIEIPARELQPGMQTYVRGLRREWIPDVKLGPRYTKSYRFPQIAFSISHRVGTYPAPGETRCVTYSPCARVTVGVKDV